MAEIPTIAHGNWHRLRGEDSSGERQMEVALAVTDRRFNMWVRRWRNVINITTGFRNADASGKQEVCIRFEVQRKQRQVRRQEDAIPKHILGYAEFAGKRVAIAIPTDVYHTRGGALQSGPSDYFYGKATLNGHVERAKGSACWIFNASPANGGDGYRGLVLLSCAHVFNLVLKNNYRPVRRSKVFRKKTAGGAWEVGDMQNHGLFFVNSSRYTRDMSIAKVVGVEGVRGIRDMLDLTPDRIADCGPGVGDLRLTGVYGTDRVKYIGYAPRRYYTITQDGSRRIRVRNAICYRTLETSSSRMRPGYSGSALVDTAGRLYGMHFYGGERDNEGNLIGYSIPIQDIIAYFTHTHNTQLTIG